MLFKPQNAKKNASKSSVWEAEEHTQTHTRDILVLELNHPAVWMP